jgi:hypothetical protein
MREMCSEEAEPPKGRVGMLELEAVDVMVVLFGRCVGGGVLVVTVVSCVRTRGLMDVLFARLYVRCKVLRGEGKLMGAQHSRKRRPGMVQCESKWRLHQADLSGTARLQAPSATHTRKREGNTLVDAIHSYGHQMDQNFL